MIPLRIVFDLGIPIRDIGFQRTIRIELREGILDCKGSIRCSLLGEGAPQEGRDKFGKEEGGHGCRANCSNTRTCGSLAAPGPGLTTPLSSGGRGGGASGRDHTFFGMPGVWHRAFNGRLL